jgi:CheY-like chemotaxis protein
MGTILVVEDEFLVALTLTEALSDEGFEVVLCTDGKAALETIYGPRRFAALVTDIRLPHGVWGNEVATAFRSHHQGGRIVFITGTPYPIGALPPELRDAPVLLKPFVPHDLVRAVRRILQATSVG